MDGRGAWALAALLGIASAQYVWNAFTVTPLNGYDGVGHAGYILTILREGRIPHPFEGWSTFHPPLYYQLAAPVWRALEPLGPRAVAGGVRMISALAILCAGLVSYRLVASRSGSWPLAWVATALALFVPVAQLSAVMEGNEALAVGFAALALPWIQSLERDPRRLLAAALAGLFAGLALATKYTGIFVAAACLVPFVRRDFDRQLAAALAVCALAGALVAGPTYARNWVLTGTPLPMTRELEPMKSVESWFAHRRRLVTDYLWISPESLYRPSIFHVAGEPDPWGSWNESMRSVWGLTYATLWYDAFLHRIPPRYHRDGLWPPPTLTFLGIVPTALVLLGFGSALAECVRRRGRSPDAPLVAMSLAGLCAFIVFTWRAPALAAVKGSYLLPLLVPAAVFFARGAQALSPRLRSPALRVSVAAAVAAAVVFTNGLVFPGPSRQEVRGAWEKALPHLPSSHMREALDRLGVVDR